MDKGIIEQLLSQEKDRLSMDGVDELVAIDNTSSCDIRYDRESGLLYREDDISYRKYTYIAKSEYGDIYKIGHTNNLRERMKTLNLDEGYSCLKLKPIAYCVRDFESIILAVTWNGRRILPGMLEKKKEIRLLSKEDVDRIIDFMGFVRIDNEDCPGFIHKTKRVYFNPDNGSYIKTEYKATINQ